MKRSRNEVARWRMGRQKSRQKIRRLEAQSRRNSRIHSIRCKLSSARRQSVLFISAYYRNSGLTQDH